MSTFDGLTASQIGDLVKVTLQKLPVDWDTLQEYVNYEASNFLWSNPAETAGRSIVFNATIRDSGQAEMSNLWATTDPTQINVQAQGEVDWKYAKTHWSFDTREIDMNSGKEQILNLLMIREQASLQSMADKLENQVWGYPTTSGSLDMNGIPYWIVPITSGSTAGFNGQGQSDAADGNTVGGINALTESRWRNYNDRWDAADSYAGVMAKDDLKKLRRMYHSLNFKAPLINPAVGENSGLSTNTRIYTGIENVLAFEDLADDRNDTLGTDVGKMAGVVVFKQTPIVHVELLDSANESTYPLYMVNHDYMKANVLRGTRMARSEPMNDVRQNNVFTIFVDMATNIVCENRQRVGGVISAVAA